MVPVARERYKFACGHIEDSDQPAHLRRLIRVFDGRCMECLGFNVSSGGKLRLLSDYVCVHTDLNLCFKHMPT